MVLPATLRLFGLSMHPWTMAETISEITKRIEAREFTQHSVLNVAKLVSAQNDQELRSSLESCDIVNADGVGIVWGARILGLHVPERVAGIDLFQNLVSEAEKRNWSIYLLGAQQEVVDLTVKSLKDRHPDLVIAGYHHGYFWDYEKQMVDQINASGATLLFVAISTPMKELFINNWQEDLGVSFVMGVGGSFDVVAGKVRRAPRWMQRSGLEWFYRLCQEPKRTWRRYLSTNLSFGILLIREKLGKWR